MDKKAMFLSVLAYEVGLTQAVISDEKALLRDEQDILFKAVDLIQDLRHELNKERCFALKRKAAAVAEAPITRKDLFAAAMVAGQVARGVGSGIAAGGEYQNAVHDSMNISLAALKRRSL